MSNKEKIDIRISELVKERTTCQWEIARKWVEVNELGEIIFRHKLLYTQLELELRDLREMLVKFEGAIEELEKLGK